MLGIYSDDSTKEIKAMIQSAFSVCLISAGVEHDAVEDRLGPYLESQLSKRTDNWEQR